LSLTCVHLCAGTHEAPVERIADGDRWRAASHVDRNIPPADGLPNADLDLAQNLRLRSKERPPGLGESVRDVPTDLTAK